jgi:hypothetical protein
MIAYSALGATALAFVRYSHVLALAGSGNLRLAP